jgi:hypothetical protein
MDENGKFQRYDNNNEICLPEGAAFDDASPATNLSMETLDGPCIKWTLLATIAISAPATCRRCCKLN